MTEYHRTTVRDLRSFGFIVGGLFGIVGLWPLIIRGQEPRWWAALIVAFFTIPAILAPRLLVPIHRGWMFIGHVLGWINTRIILAVGFYGIVFPVALIMRMLGKDPMRREYLIEADTYRIPKAAREGAHMQQQF